MTKCFVVKYLLLTILLWSLQINRSFFSKLLRLITEKYIKNKKFLEKSFYFTKYEILVLRGISTTVIHVLYECEEIYIIYINDINTENMHIKCNMSILAKCIELASEVSWSFFSSRLTHEQFMSTNSFEYNITIFLFRRKYTSCISIYVYACMYYRNPILGINLEQIGVRFL